MRVTIIVASAMSYSPLTVLGGVSNASVTISGVALDAVQSVRAVRFERGLSCSAASNNNSTVVIAAVGGMSDVSGGNRTLLQVVVGGSGLSAGVYSVCIDYVANVAQGNYVAVNSSQLLYVGAVSGFAPATVLANRGDAVVSVVGAGLDAVLSVRQVRFEPGGNGCTVSSGGAASGTVVASGSMSANSNGTQLFVGVGGIGLAPQLYSVCVDFVANVNGSNFVSAGSGVLYVGE